MKTITLLFALFIFASCQKEEVNLIPADIYGSYHGSQSCHPTYSSNPIVKVTANDNSTIKFDALRPWTTVPITVNCDGNELTIQSQTFNNVGSGGGTVTITGTGNYTSSFIALDINVHYSGGQNYTCDVSLSK